MMLVTFGVGAILGMMVIVAVHLHRVRRSTSETVELDGHRVMLDKDATRPTVLLHLVDTAGRARVWRIDARYAHTVSNDLLLKTGAALRPPDEEISDEGRKAAEA